MLSEAAGYLSGLAILVPLAPIFKTLGWALIVVFVIRVLFDAVLPGLIDAWRVKRRFKKGQQWRTDRELISWLRWLKPWEFERHVAELFKKLGYETKVVGCIGRERVGEERAARRFEHEILMTAEGAPLMRPSPRPVEHCIHSIAFTRSVG